MQCLQQKHPRAQLKHDGMMLEGLIKLVEKIINNDINAKLIRNMP